MSTYIPSPYLVTASIYRSGHLPPEDPASTARGYLYNDYGALFVEKGESGNATSTARRFHSILTVPLATDIRDDYQYGAPGATGPDNVIINNVAHVVVFVERTRAPGAGDCKRVYLVRGTPVPGGE
jgi:hypothetical protein